LIGSRSGDRSRPRRPENCGSPLGKKAQAENH
jgi:hypothetical protein